MDAPSAWTLPPRAPRCWISCARTASPARKKAAPKVNAARARWSWWRPTAPAARIASPTAVCCSVPQAAGHEIYTVEGLADAGELTGAQQAMAAAGGSQCGYCTPGFVMSLFAEHYRPGRVGPCDPLAMGGNLCRCTGYRPIRDAALALGPAPAGAWLDRLAQPPPRLDAVRLAGLLAAVHARRVLRGAGQPSGRGHHRRRVPTWASKRTCAARGGRTS